MHESRQLLPKVAHGLLDQVRAQLDALQPRLGRRDGVEDGGLAQRRVLAGMGGSGRVGEGGGGRRLHGEPLDHPVVLDDGGDGSRHLLRQGHVQHHDGLPGHAAVGVDEAAAVGAHAGLEVRPVAHRVHRLVVRHLLQHLARRRPRHLLQLQEAHGEPQGEQLAEAIFHGPHLRQEILDRNIPVLHSAAALKKRALRSTWSSSALHARMRSARRSTRNLTPPLSCPTRWKNQR